MDPITVIKVAQIAAEQLKSEEKRRRLLMTIITILFSIVFLFSVVVYVVTNPIDAIFYDSSDITISTDIKVKHFGSNEDKVWNFLKQIGFSDVGAAATMGNMYVESHFNPAANNNDIYHGICQWGLGRWSGNNISLSGFAATCGTSWTDIDTQLKFFNLECGTLFNKVYKEMINATDLIYATDYFCVKYEICPGTHGKWANSIIDGKPYQGLAERREKAIEYLNHYSKEEST